MNGSVQHGRSRSKVTVYIPSHNYGRFLRQCLQSVADQTLSDWDAILIDDGSSDQTHAEMEAFRCRFPERVQIVRNVQPCGLHGPRRQRGDGLLCVAIGGRGARVFS